MEKSHIDINTKLTLDEVRSRLQDIIVDSSNGRQTQYHQKFTGKVNDTDAKFASIYATNRNLIYYELKFSKRNDLTVVRISNSVYDRRQITSALLKGLIIPFGCVIFIIGIVYYTSVLKLLLTTIISLIIVAPCALYRPKSLTKEEYLQDESVLTIIGTINGYVSDSNSTM